MKKHYIQLPHEYISYSQKNLWIHDKIRYRKFYYDGNQAYRLNNTGLDFGKVVANALENYEETDDMLTNAAMLLLPKYDTRDKEIISEIKTKSGWIKVLGRPDMMDSTTKAFREIKTGKGVWTQNKAQKHPQLIFYATLIYLKFHVVLTECYLDWLETMDTPEGIKPTGKIESFRVTFTLLDILNCIAETSKIAKEIEIDFACYVPPPEEIF